MRWLVTVGLLLLSLVASAQEGLDGHGVVAVASDGDPDDLLLTWRPERQQAGALGLEALFEYASSPLVLSTYHDGELAERSALVDDLLALDLSASAAVHERLALGAAFPLYLASQGPDGPQGLATGDVRLTASAGVVLPSEDGTGPGLSVLPFLDLPTGSPSRNLGSGGLGGGVLVPAGWAGPRLALSANLGLALRPRLEVLDMVGGPHLVTGLGASWRLSPALALRAEAQVQPSLVTSGWSESPGEALVSARLRHPSGALFTLGGATAITPGAGAALYRVFLGVGYSRKSVSDDPDADGRVGRDDACPLRAEVLNGFKDEDGCPDQLAEVVISARDTEGEPLVDLALVDGSQVLGRTDERGELRLTGLEPGRTVSLAAADFHLQEHEPVSLVLDEGVNRQSLRLAWLPGRVTIVTRSAEGPVHNAQARFSGPVKVPGGPVTGGRQRFFLAPGDWVIAVSAPVFEIEARELSIAPDQTAEVVIEVVLRPEEMGGTWLRAVVRDEDEQPVPDVTLSDRGQLLGLTDANGELRVGGLAEGAEMSVLAEHFFLQPLEPAPVRLRPGRNDLTLDAEWLPGRVQITTRSTEGPVSSAMARFLGPKEEPGGPVTDGRRLFYLGPGQWELFVSAPGFDRERRSLDIHPDQTSVVDVTLTLRPATVREDADALVTLGTIRFDFDRATIRPESMPLVRQVAVVLAARPDIGRVEVQGHTDSGGSEEYNLDLSQRRVEAVVDALVELGVERERLVPRGYGESRPVQTNDTEAGRQANRRVEFLILDE